jgi:hypothetical protein
MTAETYAKRFVPLLNTGGQLFQVKDFKRADPEISFTTRRIRRI